MLSEINQTKTNTASFHLYVEYKRKQVNKHKTEMESQMQRTNTWLSDGRRKGGSQMGAGQ